jgi:hypothetical protein
MLYQLSYTREVVPPYRLSVVPPVMVGVGFEPT